MNHLKRRICLLLALSLLAIPLTACSSEEEPSNEEPFSYSTGIDENGFWEGLTALDQVENLEYMGISIPRENHEIAEDAVQTEIDAILANYTSTTQVTDRAIEDGDTVNIDYVGRIDGVEFENGSTGGVGREVVIGQTNFIDDFIEQLIGHMPGETFNIEVTFPEEYDNEELSGKDAVFTITVNYLVEEVEIELTDEFVSVNLASAYGWTTVAEMTNAISSELQREAVALYLQEYLLANITVKSIPDQVLTHQENAMVAFYQSKADSYSMELDDFLRSNAGVENAEELKEIYYEDNVKMVKYFVIIQAIAEDASLSVTDEDMKNYFIDYAGTDDYSGYEELYGMPYLKQTTLYQMVLDLLTENAVLS